MEGAKAVITAAAFYTLTQGEEKASKEGLLVYAGNGLDL